MRIAQVAPLIESVPPKSYGGTERIVHYLTEELVRLGHEVTLFASGDSRTNAELRSIVGRSLRTSPKKLDPLPYHIIQLDHVAHCAAEFDVIHFHTDVLQYPLCRSLPSAQVTTLHGRLDMPELCDIYSHFDDMDVISISDSQRAPLPQANWLRTVYNGIPKNLYQLNKTGGEYLVFLGRISPEKGILDAIEIALRSNRPLKIAAKVDQADIAYYESEVKPLLDHPLIEFIGEVNDADKNELLGNAYAVLFPIAWPEPFGLVMIEAMACGTPVLAYPLGAVNEVMRDGISGYIVNNIEEAVAKLDSLHSFNREAARIYFEKHFTSERMAADYIQAYELAIQSQSGLDKVSILPRLDDGYRPHEVDLPAAG